MEENHYYPYGLLMEGLTPESGVNCSINKYKFINKELQNEMGLNQYDLGARFYDPVIGRFQVIDQYADFAPGITSYRYSFDNPVSISDPNGLWEGEEEENPDGDGARPLGLVNDRFEHIIFTDPPIQRDNSEIAKLKPVEYTFDDIVNADREITLQMRIVESGYSEKIYNDGDGDNRDMDSPNLWYGNYEETVDGDNGSNAQDGGSTSWEETASAANEYIGLGSGVVENSAGISRLGNNLIIYTPTATGRVFYGNPFVKTFGIEGIAGSLGMASLGLGMFLDYRGTQIYKTQGPNAPGAVSPGKAYLNTGVGLWGMAVGGGLGFTGGTLYWGVNTFYRGGWNKAMQDNSDLFQQNQYILGSGFNLYKDW